MQPQTSAWWTAALYKPQPGPLNGARDLVPAASCNTAQGDPNPHFKQPRG